MGRLIYLTNTSLDGYIADQAGQFDFSAPSRQGHAFINDLVRATGTHLYGRRTYDVMAVWETWEGDEPETHDFAAIWRATDKVVYSRTRAEPSTTRTRIEREFDVDAVRELVAASDSDVLIGGAELAGQAITAGLVDDIHLFMAPVIIGGGTPALPDGVRLELELVAVDRFDNGVVHVHHRSSGQRDRL